MSLKHRLMYTGSSDGTAKCWVTEFGDNTVTYKGHELSVTVVRFYKGLCKYEIKTIGLTPIHIIFNINIINLNNETMVNK